MRRTLASPSLAMVANRPAAICGEVLSASIRTARRWVGAAFVIGGTLVRDVRVDGPSLWRPGHIGELARRHRQGKERPRCPAGPGKGLGAAGRERTGRP